MLPGAGLRAERERQGLRVEDVASLANIPVQAVHDIEAGQFDGLPSPAHAWQFVNRYARALDRDPGPWLDQLDEVLPHARSIHGLRRATDPLDRRRTVLYEWLVTAAAVAVLWILYSLVLHVAYRPGHNEGHTQSDKPGVEQTVGDTPSANR